MTPVSRIGNRNNNTTTTVKAATAIPACSPFSLEAPAAATTVASASAPTLCTFSATATTATMLCCRSSSR